MAIEVFNRFEKKYLLDTRQYIRLVNRLTDYMEPDEYNRDGNAYTIYNLYYDTADHALIRASLAKPAYKEKLRLRAYSGDVQRGRVYAEIKKKVGGLTNKRRSCLTPEEGYHFLTTGALPAPQPYMNRQVLREMQVLIERYRPRPMVYLAYERRAYFGIGMHDLRISFDANIRARRSELCFEAGDYGELLLPEDVWLMEIKAAQSFPVWLCRLLSDTGAYPTRFSKYGEEYKRMLRRSAVHTETARASAARIQSLAPAWAE